MIKIGFIGYGSMGSMLVNGFISAGKVDPSEIILSTRTKSKLDLVKTTWNGINIADDNTKVAIAAKYIFVCVKPLEVKNILMEIKEYITDETNIISIAGTVKIESIEALLNCKVTKLIPTLVSEVGEGVSLVCHSPKVSRSEAEYIESLLNKISTVKILKEEDFELAVEITSCGPGLIASIFEEFSRSASRHTDSISKDDIHELLVSTLSGTSRLFTGGRLSFDQTVSRVATKGGITEEGVKVFRDKLPDIFDEMFEKTLSRRKILNELTNMDFNNSI